MKLLIIILICLLSSCKTKNTNDTVYVASMTIDKIENEYNGYFYIPLFLGNRQL